MPALLTVEQVTQAARRCQVLLDGLNQVLLGQERLTSRVVTSLLARGHVLLEGLPGLGKTELVKGLSKLVALEYRRVQFTPDLLPGDITGNHVLQETAGGGHELVFRKGPIFAQMVLADEINRASPKTQSALLEAMQEHSVTVFDTTHTLPEPFFVLATQNPVELDGTYPLPEAQLDRFAMKLEVHGVDLDVLTTILMQRSQTSTRELKPLLTAHELLELIETTEAVALPQAVAGFCARIIQATRPELPGAMPLVKASLRFGASPRAGLALARCAKASALLRGSPAVGFEDVRDVAEDVLAHRLVRGYEAGLSGTSSRDVICEVLKQTQELI